MMFERAALCLLSLSASVQLVTCVFFHKPSAVQLKPGGDLNPLSDFGFTLGHSNGNLIVGSPNSNLIGQVYRCPVDVTIKETDISCDNLNFNITRDDHNLNDKFPNQKFFLGATISTTKDYFFTCAPMVTKHIQKSRSKAHEGTFGSCYLYYNNDTVQQYIGPDDRFLYDSSNLYPKTGQFEGGTSWSTLADDNGGFLIIAKTSLDGDVNYLKTSNPLAVPKSILSDKIADKLSFYVNIGLGLASGKFFANKDIVYAVSMQTPKMTGEIMFLQQQRRNPAVLKLMHTKDSEGKKIYKIKSLVVGAMFGFTMSATDLNQDDLSELLVGAPAQSDDPDEVECGALHIYLGGDIKHLDDKSRMRTIFGAKQGGRFGSAIAARDIDGDNIPEIFVSAPYEDSGVLYILSGHELNRVLIRLEGFQQVLVTKLKDTQLVEKTGMNLFGYSLQVVPDVDKNGCDEIAVGSPGSASVFLYKCFQNIKVTVKSQLIGAQNVKEKDTGFSAKVCVQIGYNLESKNITGTISVTSDIEGANARVLTPPFNVDLSLQHREYCDTVNVSLTIHENGFYKLVSKAVLVDVETKLKSKDFDPTWVLLNKYSVTENVLEITRHCDEDDCNPNLSMEISWDGSTPYELGASENQNLLVQVSNYGFVAYGACIRVSVESGASVILAPDCESEGGWLRCQLKPLPRNESQTFEIPLTMTKSNEKELNVIAKLFKSCKQDEHLLKPLKVPYLYNSAQDKVELKGAAGDLSITDKELLDKEIVSFKQVHEYAIVNNGPLTWKDIKIEIVVPKEPYIEKVNMTDMDNCDISEDEKQFTINCILTLTTVPKEKAVVPWVELSKKEVGKLLYNKKSGQEMNVTSSLYLYLDSSTRRLEKTLVTRIKLKKELSLGNNWILITIIAVILALLVLALITYILYKNGFFKRKQKKRLDVLRDSVRRRSVRLASERKQSQKTSSAADEDHMDIEVEDDCAFPEAAPASTHDDKVLIESRAQVHNNKPHHA